MNTPVKEKKIRDVMIAIDNFPCIYGKKWVREAISLIKREEERKKIPECGTLLVLNDRRDWVGVLDRKMILRFIGMHAANRTGTGRWDSLLHVQPVFRPGLFTEYCNRELDRCVEELMYPKDLLVIETRHTLLEAVYLLTEGEVEALIAVEDGEPVGLVPAAVVFEEIAGCI